MTEASGKRWQRAGWILLAWTAISLLMALRTYVRILPSGSGSSWSGLIVFQLAYWYGWALLTPLIFFLGRRFPLERGVLVRGVALHLFLGVITALVLIGHYTVLMRWQWSLASDQDAAVLASLGRPPDLSLAPLYRRYLGLYFHFDFLTYWAVLGIGHAFHYHDRFRERALRASRLESSLAEARLQALRMQIQPHFLFNTLHAISTLMDEDVGQARRTLSRLCDLMRLVLTQGSRQEVSLEDELLVVNGYLEIEQLRFQDRLRVERRIDPRALSVTVPSFFLQPLVENAVRHGVSRRPEAGRVEITAGVSDGSLRVEVLDDGPGLIRGDEGKPEEGVGLSSARRRLEERGGSLELCTREGGGARVVAVLPLRRSSGASDAGT